MSIEAMKQALEALEEFCQHANDQHQMNALSEDSWLWMMWKDGLKAITSLRQAIAKAEKHEVSQEPVSDEERKYNIRLNSLIKQIKQETVALDVTLDEAAVEMLNAFSSPLPPSLDEYNELRLMLGEGHSGYGLYLSLADYPEEGSELLVNTHPQPKREWVGLTNEDIEEAYKQAEKKEPYMGAVTRKGIAEAFEQILKEKNT
jgi:hypothetical protein